MEWILFIYPCRCGWFFFFFKHISIETLITYSLTPILVWIFFIWVFIVNVFYMVVLRFLKVHYQYGSNVYWERYIDFDVILNCTRELFFLYFTRYKVFGIRMHHHVLMWIQFCLFCQRKRKNILFTCFELNPNKKFIRKKLKPSYGIQCQTWGVRSIWCIIKCYFHYYIKNQRRFC